MKTTRQDAWTNDEDLLLAETVIRYIREGRTQLEAFKEVAKKLSRTSAACGFRWNATIRKQYYKAIESAKALRKQGNQSRDLRVKDMREGSDNDPIDKAILLLKKMKSNHINQDESFVKSQTMKDLQKENERLKTQLKRYDDAWQEISVLWNWVKEEEVKKS